MHYSTKNPKDHGLPWNPFKSLCVPRPIGWISTVDRNGICNLAPYSQFQNLTWGPPMVMFAANRTADGQRKDSVVNAQETGWFNWNMATSDLRDAVLTSSRSVASNVDEFELCKLEKKKAIVSCAPLVAASPCHFECRFVQTITFAGGDDPEETVDMVVGRVEHVHIADEALTADGKVDILRIRPLARLGYFDYTVVDNVFSLTSQQTSVPKGVAGTAVAEAG